MPQPDRAPIGETTLAPATLATTRAPRITLSYSRSASTPLPLLQAWESDWSYLGLNIEMLIEGDFAAATALSKSFAPPLPA